MAVTRIHNRTVNTYTNVSSFMIKDMNLSYTEKGILLILYSLPPGWEFSISGLSKKQNIPRATLRNAMNHLEELGYIKRVQKRATTDIMVRSTCSCMMSRTSLVKMPDFCPAFFT